MAYHRALTHSASWASVEVIERQGARGADCCRSSSPAPSPAAHWPCPGWPQPPWPAPALPPAQTRGWGPSHVGWPPAGQPFSSLTDMKDVINTAGPYLLEQLLQPLAKFGGSKVGAKPTLTHCTLQLRVPYGHWWFKATEQAVDRLYGGGNHFQ